MLFSKLNFVANERLGTGWKPMLHCAIASWLKVRGATGKMNLEYRLSRGSNKVGEPVPDRSCQCTEKAVGKIGRMINGSPCERRDRLEAYPTLRPGGSSDISSPSCRSLRGPPATARRR